MGLLGSMEARQAAAYFGVGHLLEGEVVEVGVAEVVAAVHVGAAEGFGDDVDLRGARSFDSTPGPSFARS